MQKYHLSIIIFQHAKIMHFFMSKLIVESAQMQTTEICEKCTKEGKLSTLYVNSNCI